MFIHSVYMDMYYFGVKYLYNSKTVKMIEQMSNFGLPKICDTDKENLNEPESHDISRLLNIYT